MKHFIGQRGVVAALASLLAGCASMTTPSITETSTAQQMGATSPFHDAIELGGRLSVRYQGSRQEEALHGNFTWNQTPRQTTVTLLSPLGQTMAIIDVTPDGATLAQNGQTTRTAADVDTLTADTLGWPLPVAGLREWLQGYALDQSGRRFVATPQSADVTTREGWRIRYANWQDESASSSRPHPKRIDLARATEQAGDVSIRIVIDSWQTH
jgi:outer membrane lipoprotein LolB